MTPNKWRHHNTDLSTFFKKNKQLITREFNEKLDIKNVRRKNGGQNRKKCHRSLWLRWLKAQLSSSSTSPWFIYLFPLSKKKKCIRWSFRQENSGYSLERWRQAVTENFGRNEPSSKPIDPGSANSAACIHNVNLHGEKNQQTTDPFSFFRWSRTVTPQEQTSLYMQQENDLLYELAYKRILAYTYWWVESFLWVANFLWSSWERQSWTVGSWCPKWLSHPTRMARKTPVKLKWTRTDDKKAVKKKRGHRLFSERVDIETQYYTTYNRLFNKVLICVLVRQR